MIYSSRTRNVYMELASWRDHDFLNNYSEFPVLILFDLEAFSPVYLSFLDALSSCDFQDTTSCFSSYFTGHSFSVSFTVSFSFPFPNIRLILGLAQPLDFFSLFLYILSFLVISSRLISLNAFLYTDNWQSFILG